MIFVATVSLLLAIAVYIAMLNYPRSRRLWVAALVFLIPPILMTATILYFGDPIPENSMTVDHLL